MGLGSLWCSDVLNLALPPQRIRLNTWLEHQNPVSHITFTHKPEWKILFDRDYPCLCSAYYNAWSIAETQCVIGKDKSDSILDPFLLLFYITSSLSIYLMMDTYVVKEIFIHL